MLPPSLVDSFIEDARHLGCCECGGWRHGTSILARGSFFFFFIIIFIIIFIIVVVVFSPELLGVVVAISSKRRQSWRRSQGP